MTVRSRDPSPSGTESAFLFRVSEGAGCVQPPSPHPDATMLSRLLKEHQAKQNERKELQGEPTSCLPFPLLPRPSSARSLDLE